MRNTFRFCSIFLVFFSINTLLLAQNINNNLDKLFETEFNVGDNFETFCPDGILRRNGLEDKLWKNSSIRLCFLLKDCNGSEDARNYSDANNMFGYRLGAWTYGIFAIYTNKESVGRYPEIYERKNAFRKCPIAIVNIKKESGGSRVSESIIRQNGEKYGFLLLKQLKMMAPNIIICGGLVCFEVLTKNIFKESYFIDYKGKGILFYNESEKIIVFKTFHPSASKSNNELYFPLMDIYRDFLNDENIRRGNIFKSY